jgi:hypothetical protein
VEFALRKPVPLCGLLLPASGLEQQPPQDPGQRVPGCPGDLSNPSIRNRTLLPEPGKAGKRLIGVDTAPVQIQIKLREDQTFPLSQETGQAIWMARPRPLRELTIQIEKPSVVQGSGVRESTRQPHRPTVIRESDQMGTTPARSQTDVP